MEQRALINELAQGKELARQLKAHLAAPSSADTRRLLMERILRCYEKSLFLLNSRDADDAETTISFLHESPTSKVDDQCPGDVFKKRKTASSPRCAEEVRLVSGTVVDGPPDDGYNWRKYGQKDILGSNFPRGYYRCTNRHSQGCLATKQVQRSDNDPTLFEVIYRGRHTCIGSSRLPIVSPPRIKVVPGQNNVDKSSRPRTPDRESPDQLQPIVFNFGSDNRVETEEVDTKENKLPGFSFTTGTNHMESDQNEEVDVFTLALNDNGYLDSLTPEMQEPNYFSASLVSGLTSESNLTEIVSAPASVTNSPIADAMFPLGEVSFDRDFRLDDLEFFL